MSNETTAQLGGITVWVLASGPHDNVRTALPWAPRPDIIIAADGGSVLAQQLGLTPNLIIGDLDSSPPDLVERFRAAGVEIRRFEHDTKLETDTELAALAALEWQPSTVVLLGALGGRIDHTLANLLLLTHPQLAPHDLRILDGKQEIFLAKHGMWNSIPGSKGDTVTLLPVGSDAMGVRTGGLHWPLRGETLSQGRGRGVSNSIDARDPRVWLDSGQLLVVVLHA